MKARPISKKQRSIVNTFSSTQLQAEIISKTSISALADQFFFKALLINIFVSNAISLSCRNEGKITESFLKI